MTEEKRLKMQKKNNHMTYDASTGTMSCNTCGDSYAINLPAPMEMVIAIMRVFKRIHGKCSRSLHESH